MAQLQGPTTTEQSYAFSAVVPAAGSSLRMGAELRKPLLLLDTIPILLHTLWRLRCAAGCAEIALAVHPEDVGFYTPERREVLLAEFSVKAIVPGGQSRQESVLTALEATSTSVPLALIHDAVRPLVKVDLMERVAARAAECGAALAAVPAVPTIKDVAPDGHVVRTVPRQTLWVAQTPQAFRRELILEAHHRARREGFVATDDASLVERTGYPVMVVEDCCENLKITTPADLAVAEAILRWQKDQDVRGARVPMKAAEAFLQGKRGS